MDVGLRSLKGLVDLEMIDVFGHVFVNKRHYLPTGISGDLID